MRRIARDGATVTYDVTGEGPAILLAHSLLCDGRMWRDVAPALAEHHTVLNVVLRGHGGSRAPAPFTLEDLAGDLAAVLDAEGIPRAVVAGLSMGGMVAMRLARAAPDRVAGVALLDTSAGAEGPAKRLKYGLLAAVYRRTGFTPFLLRRVAPLMFAPATLRQRPDLVAALAEQMRAHARQDLLRAVRAVVARGPFRELAAIRVPALVLAGREDRATPPALSEAIARALPDAELRLLPGAGHLTAMERPREVAEAILGAAKRAFAAA